MSDLRLRVRVRVRKSSKMTLRLMSAQQWISLSVKFSPS